MIYHVINANMFHQAPNIIKYTLQFAPQTNKCGASEHFFLLSTCTKVSYLSKMEETYDVYKEIFSEFNVKNYLFVETSFALLNRVSKIRKTDKLILHGFSSLFGKTDFLWAACLLRGRRFCKSIILIVWNGTTLKLKQKGQAGYILRNMIKKKVFSDLGYLITLSFDDEKRAKRLYPRANVISSNTIMDHYNVFNTYKKKHRRDNKYVKIMVSHSAFAHNNHFETFQLLAPFRHENIKVICPLSYGNREYQEEIIEKGIELFGDRFVYFRDLLSLPDYYSLLATLDIFIPGCNIQSGLHVVLFGLCTGIKMYLRGNNLNYVKDLGFDVNSFTELSEASFEELIQPISEVTLSKNDRLARKCFGPEEKIETWKQIYKN